MSSSGPVQPKSAWEWQGDLDGPCCCGIVVGFRRTVRPHESLAGMGTRVRNQGRRPGRIEVMWSASSGRFQHPTFRRSFSRLPPRNCTHGEPLDSIPELAPWLPRPAGCRGIELWAEWLDTRDAFLLALPLCRPGYDLLLLPTANGTPHRWRSMIGPCFIFSKSLTAGAVRVAAEVLLKALKHV